MNKLICSCLLAILGIFVEGNALAQMQKPLIWDIREIKTIKEESNNNEIYKKIIAEAIRESVKKPLSIAPKRITFEPDIHTYCSIGPYWWPDPSNPGLYINKDGFVNPESKQYDNSKLSEMSRRLKKMSWAFYLTNDKQFYNAIVRQLNEWFISSETYMKPNFEYSQIIPGQNGNRGRSTGLIDATAFNNVIESIRLVNTVKKIDRRMMTALKSWFYDFAVWADEGEYGKSLRKSNNNIGVAYDLTIVNMYLFSGYEDRAKAIVDSFAYNRIYKQIMEDGRQPVELKRSRAFSYSVYNLTNIMNFCLLARYWYPDYYLKYKERIDTAFSFLERYLDNRDAFPYKQVTSWETCREEYYQAINKTTQF